MGDRRLNEPDSRDPRGLRNIAPLLDAWLSFDERMPAAAVGRVSAELIAPYPPGVPVIAPGEVVTEAVLSAIASARASGVRVAYAADPTALTIQVLA